MLLPAIHSITFSVVLGVGSLALVTTYPLFKRFTHYPQIILGQLKSFMNASAFFHSICLICCFKNVYLYDPFLHTGLTFNWGIILGFAALKGYIDPLIVAPMYLAGLSWTMVYDTIYAHQV